MLRDSGGETIAAVMIILRDETTVEFCDRNAYWP
jgi:hypothetical protein